MGKQIKIREDMSHAGARTKIVSAGGGPTMGVNARKTVTKIQPT